MDAHKYVRRLIPYHLAIKDFDYNAVVDWATQMVEEENDSEAVLMLATFSKPVSAYEIKPYIRAYLQEQGLKEENGEAAVWALIRYYMEEIRAGKEIRKLVHALFDLYFEHERFGQKQDFGLADFYFLHYAWVELQFEPVSNYYEHATLGNIKSICKDKAQEWLEKYGEK